MQGVILAAGRGTRMGALTENCSKPMLLLLGKPMLEWKLAMLPEEIDEVILVIGYLGDGIKKHFGNTWQGRAIRYVVQEKLDGSGGALVLCRKIFSGKALVTMGDDLYVKRDLAKLIEERTAVLGIEVEDASQFGLLERTEEGLLEKITERPHGYTRGVACTGAYLLDERFFEYAPVKISETEYGLPQTLALMGQDTPVQVLEATDWQPVGTPEDIVRGENFLHKYFDDRL